jgi:hypothetical protein
MDSPRNRHWNQKRRQVPIPEWVLGVVSDFNGGFVLLVRLVCSSVLLWKEDALWGNQFICIPLRPSPHHEYKNARMPGGVSVYIYIYICIIYIYIYIYIYRSALPAQCSVTCTLLLKDTNWHVLNITTFNKLLFSLCVFKMWFTSMLPFSRLLISNRAKAVISIVLMTFSPFAQLMRIHGKFKTQQQSQHWNSWASKTFKKYNQTHALINQW